MLPRILTGLVGLLMAVITLGWLADPSSAAANLGMSLLDGLGRSTQIGDFTAFLQLLLVSACTLPGKKMRIGRAARPQCCCWRRYFAPHHG